MEEFFCLAVKDDFYLQLICIPPLLFSWSNYLVTYACLNGILLVF